MNSSRKLLDLRVRRTYKLLWGALLSLIAEQDFETVTVTDICERAMVHRTTFYKHYEDKYGLLYHGMQDELNSLFDALNITVDQPTENTDASIAVMPLVIMFEHVLAHERFYRLMLGGSGISKFYALWQKSLANRLEDLFKHHRQWDANRAAVPIPLRAHLHAGAIISVIGWWLENDCLYKPAELAHYVWQEVFG